jgi:hypothetical protein
MALIELNGITKRYKTGDPEVTGVVGVVFGTAHTHKAARKKLIDALRYE